MDSRRQPSSRRDRPRFEDPFDRRLDQWLETGRQLVDGVSGARPGRRGAPGRSGRSAAASLDAMGRWVGDKIDWLLDEEEDWDSGWDSPRSSRASQARESLSDAQSWDTRRGSSRQTGPSVKRPLEAISKRQPPLISPARDSSSRSAAGAPSIRQANAVSFLSQVAPAPQGQQDTWPDDDSFRVDRWQRMPGSGPLPQPEASPSSVRPGDQSQGVGRRPLPRSSRRRA